MKEASSFPVHHRMERWPSCSSFAIIPISLVANITLNSKASRTNRIRFSKDSFRRVSNIRVVRRALQAIENRRAESLSRNSFCNNKIEIKLVELAQTTK